jgi:hypothetical protein
MSFGFPTRDTAIQEAIKYAFYRDVIMFAAASNGGGNRGIAYPANQHSMVICINSTDGKGNVSGFSPNRDPRSENFATLGEVVESAWPSSKHDDKQCKSGTSYATPIAVAVAATLLQYVRWKLPESNNAAAKRLRSCDGMKAVLAEMSEDRDRHGYMYIAPWKFLHVSPTNPETSIKERILRVLRNL